MTYDTTCQICQHNLHYTLYNGRVSVSVSVWQFVVQYKIMY